jgi:hypothetical protein
MAMIKSGQFEQWKYTPLKKSQKAFNANIFVRINFKNLTKKWWNSIFITLYIICKFEQNLPKEVVKEVNGIRLLFKENRTQRQDRILKIGYLVFRTHTSNEYFTNVLNVYSAADERELTWKHVANSAYISLSQTEYDVSQCRLFTRGLTRTYMRWSWEKRSFLQ